MKHHIKACWLAYAAFAALAALLALIASMATTRQHRLAACYAKQMILIDTDAGPRCAPLASLHNVKG